MNDFDVGFERAAAGRVKCFPCNFAIPESDAESEKLVDRLSKVAIETQDFEQIGCELVRFRRQDAVDPQIIQTDNRDAERL